MVNANRQLSERQREELVGALLEALGKSPTVTGGNHAHANFSGGVTMYHYGDVHNHYYGRADDEPQPGTLPQKADADSEQG